MAMQQDTSTTCKENKGYGKKKKPEPFDQLIVYFQALIYTYDTKQLYSCE